MKGLACAFGMRPRFWVTVSVLLLLLLPAPAYAYKPGAHEALLIKTIQELETDNVFRQAVEAAPDNLTIACWGAQGPDIPVASMGMAVDYSPWWDAFHYERVAPMAKALIQSALATPNETLRKRRLAFCLGWVTHLCGDMAVHGYLVNPESGCYLDQGSDHALHKTLEAWADPITWSDAQCGALPADDYSSLGTFPDKYVNRAAASSEEPFFISWPAGIATLPKTDITLWLAGVASQNIQQSTYMTQQDVTFEWKETLFDFPPISDGYEWSIVEFTTPMPSGGYPMSANETQKWADQMAFTADAPATWAFSFVELLDELMPWNDFTNKTVGECAWMVVQGKAGLYASTADSKAGLEVDQNQTMSYESSLVTIEDNQGIAPLIDPAYRLVSQPFLGWTTDMAGPNQIPYGASGFEQAIVDKAAPRTIVFTGPELRLLCTKGPNWGKLRVTLDHGTPEIIDLYKARNPNDPYGQWWRETVFSRSAMKLGPHELTLEWTGDKNPASSSTQVNYDGVRIISSIFKWGMPWDNPGDERIRRVRKAFAVAKQDSVATLESASAGDYAPFTTTWLLDAGKADEKDPDNADARTIGQIRVRVRTATDDQGQQNGDGAQTDNPVYLFMWFKGEESYQPYAVHYFPLDHAGDNWKDFHRGSDTTYYLHIPGNHKLADVARIGLMQGTSDNDPWHVVELSVYVNDTRVSHYADTGYVDGRGTDPSAEIGWLSAWHETRNTNVSADGQLWSHDVNWSDVRPTTAASINGQAPPPADAWYRGTVDVGLKVIGPTAEWGGQTYYSFDGPPNTPYTGPIRMSGEGLHPISFRSVDSAGGVEDGYGTYTVRIDDTPPTITGSVTTRPNANGWYNSDVTVHFEANDPIGSAGPAAVSGLAYVTPDITVRTEGANQEVEGVARDKAGNETKFKVTGINIDKTPPVITIVEPKDGAEYVLNQPVNADWTAIDSLSGIQTASGTTASGKALDTSVVNQNEFTVQAEDKAGNTASRTVRYWVRYVYSGLSTPLNGKPFNQGQSVALKFDLTDWFGRRIDTAVCRLTHTRIRPDGTAAETSNGQATNRTGNAFLNTGTSGYQFNLATKPLAASKWQLNIMLDDGTVKHDTITVR